MKDRPIITFTERGGGRPALILHGGGPFTVAPIADGLAATICTIVPIHPGWNGTERPGQFERVSHYARAYLDLLEDLDLTDVLVVGSSLGG